MKTISMIAVALSLLAPSLALAKRGTTLDLNRLQITRVRDEGHKATYPVITGKIGAQKVWLTINSPGFVGRFGQERMVNGWEVYATTNPKQTRTLLGAELLTARQVGVLGKVLAKTIAASRKPSETSQYVLKLLQEEDFRALR